MKSKSIFKKKIIFTWPKCKTCKQSTMVMMKTEENVSDIN